jgi:glutathionylspermidine synthase
MKRIPITPRQNWQQAVEKLGFGFHSTNVPYWDESAYYQFSAEEIDLIENASLQLWEMCLNAVQFVIEQKQYNQFHIPEWFIPHIEQSWKEDHPSIYGRFDLAYDGREIKMLEFNADTPTSLFEAGIVQWFWLKDFDESKDQFNSIHERLLAYWGHLKEYLYPGTLHFSCIKRSLEDLTTTEYLRDCAMQANIDTKLIFIDDIGWDEDALKFVDMEAEEMKNIFKLYPYEWMVHERFGKNIIMDKNNALWIEPSWKMILSNKAILPILWFLYPGHPFLLKSYFDQGDLCDYVKKPLLSREGANVEIFKGGQTLEKSGGEYGEEGHVYQQLFNLPCIDGNYPILGSWIIGQEPAGLGIRESSSLITSNTSRFIPHLIQEK